MRKDRTAYPGQGETSALLREANGFVFISATPPVDMVTGEMVRGDIETQTEASSKALKHCLEAAGRRWTRW